MTETIMSLSFVGFGTTTEMERGIGCRLFRYAGEGVEKNDFGCPRWRGNTVIFQKHFDSNLNCTTFVM